MMIGDAVVRVCDDAVNNLFVHPLVHTAALRLSISIANGTAFGCGNPLFNSGALAPHQSETSHRSDVPVDNLAGARQSRLYKSR